MPNKTIYVSDGDLTLFQRAQDIAGGNLSSAISTALRRYVEVEDGRREGFEEIILRVGVGHGRKVRFVGVLLGEWMDSNWSRVVTYHVYRSRTGRFVLHIEKTAEEKTVDREGKPAGWRGYLGIGEIGWGMTPPEKTVEVIDSLEKLQEKIPPQLYEMVAGSATGPVIEDLDI